MSPEARFRVEEQLRIDEGVKYEIYLDHLGYPTFGIGHLITDADPEVGMDIGAPITEERVAQAFERDLDLMIEECEKQYPTWNDLPEEVQEILVNMMFNLGRTRLNKFKKMNAAIARREWKVAAAEGRDSRWYNQVTNRAERLMSRLEQVEPKKGCGWLDIKKNFA